MTQSSRPQPDHIINYPFPSDPGPYSSDQWAQVFQILYTSDQQTLQGAVCGYLNSLAVTDNGSTEVYVDTGAGIVNGHVLISTEQETWVVPAGPVATRTDRVVMVENNQNVAVTQTTGGRPLLFPNDLSEYVATPAIPPYSARLAIVRGADGAGLPAIDQTTALYMVELYRYVINNVPAISSQVDYRPPNWVNTPMASVQKLDEYEVTSVTGVQASITFSSIPGVFRHLRLEYIARGDTGGANTTFNVRFNGDAGNNYDSIRSIESHANTLTTTELIAGTSMMGGSITGGGAPASTPTTGTLFVNGYATAFHKAIHGLSNLKTANSGGNIQDIQAAGWWRNTAVVTSITVFPSLGNFDTGTIFSLYGLT